MKSQVASTEPIDRDNHTELSRSDVAISNQAQCNTEIVAKILPERDTHP